MIFRDRPGAAGMVFVATYAVGAALLLRLALGQQVLPRFMDLFVVGVTVTAFCFSWQYALVLYGASILIGTFLMYPFLHFEPPDVAWRLGSYSVVSLLVLVVVHRLQQSRDEARHARSRLDETAEQYRRLFEEAPIAYHEIDGEGIVRRVNRTECALLGLDQGEIIGKHVWELVEPGERELSKKSVLRKLAGKQPLLPFRRTYSTARGPVVVEVHEKLIRDAGGAITGMRSALLDVTERERLQEQLAQAQRLDSIGSLAGGIAHDFNNLLTIILGYCDMLVRELADRIPVRERVDQIRRAGERAASLTRQLLAFSRRQVLHPRVLELNALAGGMMEMLRRLIGEDIQLHYAPGAGLGHIRADPSQVEQVIMNLAANARDAMPAGGQLTIETANAILDTAYVHKYGIAVPGHYVMLSVTDTGAGMDAETRARIFEPFFTTKEPGRGTGLGLSTAYGIVRQSDGYIWVYSEPGRGSTFKVYFPRVDEPVDEVEPAAAREVVGGKETILVVEDEEQLRELIVLTLRRFGYTVLEAGGAAAALELCRQRAGAIDLLLSDVILPETGGVEMARQVLELKPEAKVLYTSGYTPNAIVQHGVLKPGVHLLEKPFTPDEVARKVRQVLGERAAAASVIVVDDDPQVRALFRLALEQAGYRVREAANGREARRLFARQAADLVITDLVMPEEEGLETIRAMRRDYPSLKILAVSGAFGGRFLGIAQRFGANATLNKPVRAEALLEAVRKLMS